MFLYNSKLRLRFFFTALYLHKQPQRYQSVNVAWRIPIRHPNLIFFNMRVH